VFDANNRIRTDGTRILVDAALATGARRVVAQSIAFAYAPTQRDARTRRSAGAPGHHRIVSSSGWQS
jgi:hypothetical protein